MTDSEARERVVQIERELMMLSNSAATSSCKLQDAILAAQAALYDYIRSTRA